MDVWPLHVRYTLVFRDFGLSTSRDCDGVSVCPLGSAVCVFVPGFREVFHSGSLSISCGALILSGRVLSSCEEEETRRNSSVEGA